MTNDPIADLLIRIKNGGAVRKKEVPVPHSTIKEAILVVLKNGGYIADYRLEEEGRRKTLIVTVRYGANGRHVITGVRRVSSSSRHVYVSARDIVKWVRGRSALGIISTSRGVMSHRQAREQNLGGELLGIVRS